MDDLLQLLPRDAIRTCSRWTFSPRVLRVPPSSRALAACGFGGSEWAPGRPRDAANLLLLLHGLQAKHEVIALPSHAEELVGAILDLLLLSCDGAVPLPNRSPNKP